MNTNQQAADLVAGELGRFALNRHESCRRRLIEVLVHFCLREGMMPLRVRSDYADLADVIPGGGVRANHCGEALQWLAKAGVVRLDRQAEPGALLIWVQADSRMWSGLFEVCDAATWQRRCNRLRQANGCQPVELFERAADLESALISTGLERAQAGIRAGSTFDSTRVSPPASLPDNQARQRPGARVLPPQPRLHAEPIPVPSHPLSGSLPDLGCEHPDLGCAAPPIHRAGARAVDIDVDKTVDISMSISKSNENELPDSGWTTWESDGYILEKLRRQPQLLKELRTGITTSGRNSRLAFEFAQLFEASPDRARTLIGCLAQLPPINTTGRATNPAAWLNRSVTQQLSQLQSKESLSTQ